MKWDFEAAPTVEHPTSPNPGASKPQPHENLGSVPAVHRASGRSIVKSRATHRCSRPQKNLNPLELSLPRLQRFLVWDVRGRGVSFDKRAYQRRYMGGVSSWEEAAEEVRSVVRKCIRRCGLIIGGWYLLW